MAVLRVGIDARFITFKPRRGIGNYSLGVVTELVRLCPATKFFLYISSNDDENLLPAGENVIVKKIGVNLYPIWEQIFLPIVVKRDGVEVLHCLGNTAPLFLAGNIKLVVTLHDVMFLQSNQFLPKASRWYQRLGRVYRAFVVSHIVNRADRVVTVSEYSAKDILKYFPKMHPSKICVTHQSYDCAFDIKVSSSDVVRSLGVTEGEYIFALGAEDPRKNTKRLVSAFLSLMNETEEMRDSLVIAGYANWKNSKVYSLIKSSGAESRVIFAPFVSSKELVYLYQNAKGFIYPSLYEGFGIPILEAFQSGCPVMASNSSSIPEVAGPAVMYFNPLDQNDIEQSMKRFIEDSEYRETLRALGRERVKQFTWLKTAEKTLSIYRNCVE